MCGAWNKIRCPSATAPCLESGGLGIGAHASNGLWLAIPVPSTLDDL